MAGRLARIQARGNAEAILTAAGVSLLQDHGTAAAGYPDTLRIRPTGMGWMVGWCRSDPVNAVNIYVLYKPPPWLASLGSRLARLPGHGGYLWPLVMGFWKPKCHCAWKTRAAATLKISIPRARDFMSRLRQGTAGITTPFDIPLPSSILFCSLKSAPLPLALVPSLAPGLSSPQVAGAPAHA
ncbi:hypothetical protein CABS01_03133 [Colletotrichum abscissum]|uniref:Uncharacterized protein n=2 Tax=Colletotrichum acutatum species complex TaxID=2707335 RepID=A0A9P9X829_9PEZI|nr:uncharacterized protein CLUP02_08532 [Colletotrichum lupini]XP_060392429.1 uncharacterized protein CABS01_03133 [Colletotrichum abscissum]KAI3540735.1 hypothetical protein CABS02_10951 [Colletotrichum abscissum]KAK1477831.1 hypothetical protein CABS01_03133 [Colletotrichum abscissum]UQC83042.1 hypothetical protein CLUP02_08532 [Colletotrichum lupini]